MACDNYQPDHNGECLTCDEGAADHINMTWPSDKETLVLYRAFPRQLLMDLRSVFLLDRNTGVAHKNRLLIQFCDSRLDIINRCLDELDELDEKKGRPAGRP